MISKITSVFQYGFTPLQLTNYFKYKLNRRTKTVLNYRPLWLLIYVTDLCNLHCKMCPHHTTADSSHFEQSKRLNKNYISLNTLQHSFDLFPESYFVMLAGVGEPLLHPKFKEIILMCERNNKKVKLVTNGTRLTRDISEFLAGKKCISEVQISLNAPDPETYYHICQGDEKEFFLVVNNIKNLVEVKKRLQSSMKIVTSAVCGNEFKEKASSFLLFADKLGVDQIELFRYIDFNIVGNNFSDIQDDRKFVDELYSFAIKNIRAFCTLPHIVGTDTFSSECDWYWKNISIDSNGNIGSCGRVVSPDQTYGNIYDQNDVWNNSYMQEMRKRFLEGEILPSECCKACIENNRIEG